ncbi:MAG TPA: sigma factor [Solirubrobacterales bacterium]|nr:sigma factor [Solirubrobacterales bacterium]
MLNAVDRFDPERGIPFTAFASPTILGELKRHFRDRVWTVRVPRSGSKRSTALSKPRLATCSRSSKDSLAPR